jgi:hypothetical protein
MSSFAAVCLVIFAQKPWRSEMGKIVSQKNANNFSSAVDTKNLSFPLSSFVRDGEIPFDDRLSLPPLSMILSYIDQHGEQALFADWESNNTEHRRFSVVHYSCPQQLGNRLHQFFNDFLLAFLTNRTILWKYWTREDCIQLGNQYDHSICIDFNRSLSIDNPAECANIMETAPWIPRYDVWSKRLNLPNPPVQVWTRPINPRNAPQPVPDSVKRIQWILDTTDKKTNQTILGVSDKHKLTVFQPLVGALSLKYVERELTRQDDALSRAKAIFHYGADFWHGALFDQAFRIRPDFLNSVRPFITHGTNESTTALATASITLHARHTNPLDDGSNITNEQNCLQDVLGQMAHLNITVCRLFLLSDRSETLTRLRAHIGTKCEVVQATHRDTTTDALEVEHGPFAGVGFVQDLELASREASRSLRSFWIGHSRSSSKLLREWLTYRRAIWFWKNYGFEPSHLPTISQCQLPG